MGWADVSLLYWEGPRSPNGEIFALLVSRLVRRSRVKQSFVLRKSDRCRPCRGRRKGSARFWDNLQKEKNNNNVPNADLPRCKGDGGRIGYDVCVYISERK